LIPAGPHSARRRRRGTRAQRILPLALLAVAAFSGGVVTAMSGKPDELRAVERYAAAWTRGDYGAMHALLSPSAKRRFPLDRFTRLHRNAAETATVDRVERTGPIRRDEDAFLLPARAVTRVFGTLNGTVRLPVVTEDDAVGVAWERHMVLPGLRRGEKLRRDVVAPPRGTLQARDGTVIASGPDRTAEGTPPAGGIVGTVGPIPEDREEEFARAGYPDGAVVGLSGLEREFESRLAGRFGGFLRASGRVLARSEARKAKAVRTSIDLGVQEAAVTALGARLGGIAVMRPRNGEVLALAGIAYSAPQPPGSVFKIITLAGALEEKAVKPNASFPVLTAATIEGVELENANGESCGGSLTNSFAHSCNSVFAPLGAKLGAKKLVATAEAFGFNEPPSLKGAATSTIPSADEIGDDLAVGSSAIGQGIVQATPLTMVEVAAAIANRGQRVRATLLKGAPARRARAISARTARIVDRMMRRVVSGGTGTAAAIPGVIVAGKTGTAELRDTTPDEPSAEATPAPVVDDTSDTTAWFVAYAPARRPRVAVAVMLPGQGAGGASAAPLAREVLVRALKR
jgi:cell division protein FtsI/penicillin-binding protein 2